MAAGPALAGAGNPSGLFVAGTAVGIAAEHTEVAHIVAAAGTEVGVDRTGFVHRAAGVVAVVANNPAGHTVSDTAAEVSIGLLFI